MLFDLKTLRGDIFGGIASAVEALPLALAFGVASGLGPVAGLYGAIVVGFLAAVLGGTPALILALVNSIDSLLTSLVADSMTRTQHNSDRELCCVRVWTTWRRVYWVSCLGRVPPCERCSTCGSGGERRYRVPYTPYSSWPLCLAWARSSSASRKPAWPAS